MWKYVENYYHEDNSFLDRVVASRQGTPLSLCILFHAQAQILGLAVHQMFFPCHDMNLMDCSASSVRYLDLFYRGRCMTLDQVVAQSPTIAENIHAAAPGAAQEVFCG